MGSLAVDGPDVVERFAVGGMTCGACERHVETAIARVPGVRSVRVDLASATATIWRDPAVDVTGALCEAVMAAGYVLTVRPPVGQAPPAGQVRLPIRPIVFGLLGAAGLFVFYLVVITIAQDWGHALQQLAADRWFVAAIVAGFGTQIGLFTHLRSLHAHAAAGGVAASTGTSTAAMLACCAHHLTEVFTVLGLSGAALFLNMYKTPLLWLGVTMNLAGIVYLVWQIRRQSRMTCHSQSSRSLGNDPA